MTRALLFDLAIVDVNLKSYDLYTYKYTNASLKSAQSEQHFIWCCKHGIVAKLMTFR